MNVFDNKNIVYLVTGIMIFVATALIFVLPLSLTVFIAYFFTMLAIVMFGAGSLHMLSNPKSYPWYTAFPVAIWQYLVAQLTLSAGFVFREIFFISIFPVGLFFFLHVSLLGFFAVKLLLIKGGKEIIDAKDTEIKQQVSSLRLMQADVESILRNHPEHEKPLHRVMEALRYSDPVSHPSVYFYEEQIQRGIFSMMGMEGNDPAKIPEICENLINQIADRNSRVRIMK